MQLFKRECNGHPLKPKYPEYREWGGATVTVLHPAEVGVQKEEISLEELNERQRKAIEHIEEKKKITRRIYCNINNIGDTYAKKELNNLIRNKIIKRMGKGKNTYYVLVTE